MARYSRRTGPVANFELTAARQIIPGFTITRFFDAGELLIMMSARINNGSAAVVTGQVAAQIDGQDILPDIPTVDAAPGDRVHLAQSVIVSVAAGVHTITLTGIGGAAVGDHIVFEGAQLTVVQLPLWDRDTDIT